MLTQLAPFLCKKRTLAYGAAKNCCKYELIINRGIDIKFLWIHSDGILQGLESFMEIPMHHVADVMAVELGTVEFVDAPVERFSVVIVVH